MLNVVLRREDVRELVLSSPMPAPVDETFDLRGVDRMTLMRDALRVFLADHDRIIRVIGRTTQGAKSEIEVTLHEWPLREAMIAQGQRILLTSLVLSLATAALLFLMVQRLIVRPIGRVVDQHGRLPRRSRGREPGHRARRAAPARSTRSRRRCATCRCS